MTTTGGDYSIHTAPRGPHWIGWVTRGGSDKPDGAVVIVAASREEAERNTKRWAEQKG